MYEDAEITLNQAASQHDDTIRCSLLLLTLLYISSGRIYCFNNDIHKRLNVDEKINIGNKYFGLVYCPPITGILSISFLV